MDYRFQYISYTTQEESLQPHRLHVVGVGPGEEIAGSARTVLQPCRIIFTSPRLNKHLEFFRGPVLGLSPLSPALLEIEHQLEYGDVGVLVGGDPLFFGIARRLSTEFGTDRIDIHPATSSMQIGYARLKMPWDDVQFTSLHGRSEACPTGHILIHDRICILTGGANSPECVAGSMVRNGISDYRVWVLENLGEPEERITAGTLEDISGGRFAEMSLMVLERNPGSPAFVPFGLSETEISHTRGLITKDEIRAVVLHHLKLPMRGVFWDIGAGSGSVSVEASRVCPDLDIYTIERNPVELENIQDSVRRFGRSKITIVAGEAPQVCVDLPNPDRIFIGGSGGRLRDILQVCSGRLRPGGRIVLTAVTESTRHRAPGMLAQCGFTVRASGVTVQRLHWSSRGEETTNLNPIFVIVGIK